jgi:hypothetical protein
MRAASWAGEPGAHPLCTVAVEKVPMTDDERPLIDPRLFTPTELLSEDMDHSIDVGDTRVEVHHTLEVDQQLPLRRIEFGAIVFGLLVVGIGIGAPVEATIAISAALSTVLLGNVVLRWLRQ